MTRLIDRQSLTASGAATALEFTRTGGGRWAEWNRYLELAGRRAYSIGNICNTCEFLFQRLDGANQSVTPGADLARELDAGLRTVAPGLLDRLGDVVPAGRYSAALLEVRPRLVRPGSDDDYFCREQTALWGVDAFWGLPHDPRTEYYRVGSHALGEGRMLFEFLIPMHPHGWLDSARVLHFENRFEQGDRPTALALSVLDVKHPAEWEDSCEITEHWCLAHYLLDGHHKTYAAAKAGAAITLLGLVAVDQGVSQPEQVETGVAALRFAAA